MSQPDFAPTQALEPAPSTGAAKQMFGISLLATVAAIVVLGVIAYAGANRNTQSVRVNTDTVEQRIAKVGTVDVQIQQAARTAPATGEEVFKAQCSACHGTGLNGAPKFGDTAAWAPRIAQGQATLEQAPIKGFKGATGVMPPQSGGQFSDYEIERAVVYMANAGGAKFTEPPAPANAASDAEPAASAAQ